MELQAGGSRLGSERSQDPIKEDETRLQHDKDAAV